MFWLVCLIRVIVELLVGLLCFCFIMLVVWCCLFVWVGLWFLLCLFGDVLFIDVWGWMV